MVVIVYGINQLAIVLTVSLLSNYLAKNFQPAFTWSKLTIQTIEEGVKYVQIFSIVNFEHVIAGWVKEYLLNLEYMSIPLISTLSRVTLSTIFT